MPAPDVVPAVASPAQPRARFRRITTPEPHGVRRRFLLRRHPELRRLQGHDPRTTAVVLAIVAAQLGIAAFFQRHGAGPLLVLAAGLVGGTLNHWAGMGIHEAAHNLAARTPLGNRAVALVANIPIVFPAAMPFRRHHLRHHSHLGVPHEDNDLATDWEIRWVGRSPVRKLLWLAFYPVFATMARGFVRRPDRWELLNVGLQLVFGAAIAAGIGPTGLGYLCLSTFFGFGLLHPAAAHFIHEHYLWDEDQETYSYYGWLNWVTFHVGYHAEHHDLPGVPCWRLPAVRAAAPELYAPLTTHRSWTGVLARFVLDRRISHASRLTRESPRGGPDGVAASPPQRLLLGVS